MPISVQVIADSISSYGKRLTTILATYPRFIHAEVMTHRVFSRNASSSRAIPFVKLRDEILSGTAMPIHWGKNQPGMQAFEEHNAPVSLPAYMGRASVAPKMAWEMAAGMAMDIASAFWDAGYHKQIVNRLVEPFSHIHVVITSTEWDNFFGLRCHPDAQPEIRELANQVRMAMDSSSPVILKKGEWHLPFVTNEDWAQANMIAVDNAALISVEEEEPVDTMHHGDTDALKILLKVSSARCARTSYRTFDGKISTVQADIALCDKLTKSRPIHSSPFEHQGTPDEKREVMKFYRDEMDNWDMKHATITEEWDEAEKHGNFEGFVQYRKVLEASFA